MTDDAKPVLSEAFVNAMKRVEHLRTQESPPAPAVPEKTKPLLRRSFLVQRDFPESSLMAVRTLAQVHEIHGKKK